MTRLCLVEDDSIMGESLADRFALEGIDACWCKSAEDAEGRLGSEQFSAVVCDIRLPGMSGDTLYERLRRRRPVLPPFIFITGFGDLDRAVELLKLGAADYITKPFDLDMLLARVRDLTGAAPASGTREDQLGVSPAMARVDGLLARIAPLDATVLIRGETGTGKEVVARAIHDQSRRRGGPMLRVNCGAVPPGLIDSELFGHERGSFTGAVSARAGWFERADGGTLFLDEIGELALAAQVRLLRVLQESVLERVGGHRTIRVDVRVITATHRDLEDMVREGRFREDLWYRISVFPIPLPPLRTRREDIPALAAHFAWRAGKRIGGAPLVPSPADVDLLLDYDWPGNVRELAAVVERAAILGDGRQLDVAGALGAQSERGRRAESPSQSPPRGPFPSLDEIVAQHIEAALSRTRGRIEGPAGAGALLRVNPHTLRSRMRKLGLDWRRFRA